MLNLRRNGNSSSQLSQQKTWRQQASAQAKPLVALLETGSVRASNAMVNPVMVSSVKASNVRASNATVNPVMESNVTTMVMAETAVDAVAARTDAGSTDPRAMIASRSRARNRRGR